MSALAGSNGEWPRVQALLEFLAEGLGNAHLHRKDERVAEHDDVGCGGRCSDRPVGVHDDVDGFALREGVVRIVEARRDYLHDVAIRLDEITTEHIKKREAGGMKDLDDLSKENLKKISRYYRKWMDGAMLFGLGHGPLARSRFESGQDARERPARREGLRDRRGQTCGGDADCCMGLTCIGNVCESPPG